MYLAGPMKQLLQRSPCQLHALRLQLEAPEIKATTRPSAMRTCTHHTMRVGTHNALVCRAWRML